VFLSFSINGECLLYPFGPRLLSLYAFLRAPVRFDAFRSIFPAGTVSGAPKIKAIELVGGLEQERRGVYAGAVGRFDFDQDELDTCIAIRTMTFKDGVAYLQAGTYRSRLDLNSSSLCFCRCER
jgi:hypothetical protein